jgi:dipeptidyl aminopeptidase/acylaminoacyl peptidase
MFAALKGNGATVRYVVLPHEAHGYRARESVGHTLWEMHGWLERYVRPACAR